MDRNESLRIGEAGKALASAGDSFVLPSRRAVVDACLSRFREGPILITGEAGVGKTWLARRIAAEVREPLSWIMVDMTPAVDATDLLRLITHKLGLETRGSLGQLRLELADFLQERAGDGRCWGLVIDELHLATTEVLEEIRVLSNRLNMTDGFASIILIGQSSLARRLSTRTLASLEDRLVLRVHLRPLDVDEAQQLLERAGVRTPEDVDEIDRRHCSARGNPRQLLRQTPRVSNPAPARKSQAPVPQPAPQRSVREEIPTSTQTPSARIGETKPPLRVEDGLIEVGWSADNDSEIPPDSIPEKLEQPGLAEETIQDHYAALQAWQEWETNQPLSSAEGSAADASLDVSAVFGDPNERAKSNTEEAESSLGNVRVEGEHGFAPYSQLFSRMKQANDRDSGT